MGIDSHGSNGHSHSHTGCFPFLPIPIPNFVTNSHYRGNPMGFPFPLVKFAVRGWCPYPIVCLHKREEMFEAKFRHADTVYRRQVSDNAINRKCRTARRKVDTQGYAIMIYRLGSTALAEPSSQYTVVSFTNILYRPPRLDRRLTDSWELGSGMVEQGAPLPQNLRGYGPTMYLILTKKLSIWPT